MDTDLLELSSFGSEKAPNFGPEGSLATGDEEENVMGGNLLTFFESKLNTGGAEYSSFGGTTLSNVEEG